MTVGNEPISYQSLGEGVPLLFIHGGFSDGPLTWGVQMEELASRHRLLVVDRRGHGKSPKAPYPYTIAGDAADIMQVLDSAGICRFHIVGHSYGGLVALEIASRTPDRILSLHMVEPPYLSLLAHDPAVKVLIESGISLFAQAPSLSTEEIAAGFFRVLLGEKALARLRTRPAWQVLVREAAAESHAQFPSTYPPEVATKLCLHAPVQVYYGEQSSLAMRNLALATADATGAKLIPIPQAGHDLQRTSEFNSALLACIESVDIHSVNA